MKIIIPLLLVAFVILLYYSTKESSLSSSVSNVSYTSSLEYSNILESKLKGLLGSIDGVGNVSVMVTLESGPELKIATQIDERTNTTTNSSGTTTSVTIVEEPIIITQKGEDSPLVLMEILPVVKGVVVVAEGAKDVGVKLQLLEAVQALLDLASVNIQILWGISEGFMLSKKKRIIILSGFVALLAVTGILNIVINNNVAKNVSAGYESANANFFVTYRADRQDTRSQEIVYLDAIIASANSSAEAKNSAESKKQELVAQMESELMLEGLIKSKGFADAIVSTSSSNINVIVKSAELMDSEVAQIVEIIQGQTNYNLENIKIIPVE